MLALVRRGTMCHEEVGPGTQFVDVGKVGKDIYFCRQMNAPSRDSGGIEAAIVRDHPVGGPRAKLLRAPPRHPAGVLLGGEDKPRRLGEKVAALLLSNPRETRLEVEALRKNKSNGSVTSTDMREESRETEAKRTTVEPVVEPKRRATTVTNSRTSKRPVEREAGCHNPLQKRGVRGDITEIRARVMTKPGLPRQRLPLV